MVRIFTFSIGPQHGSGSLGGLVKFANDNLVDEVIESFAVTWRVRRQSSVMSRPLVSRPLLELLPRLVWRSRLARD